MGGDTPKTARKYRWAATTANLLYIFSLVMNVWKRKVPTVVFLLSLVRPRYCASQLRELCAHSSSRNFPQSFWSFIHDNYKNSGCSRRTPTRRRGFSRPIRAESSDRSWRPPSGTGSGAT